MDSPLLSDAERAEFLNTAEEILIHVRKVARRMQERIRKALDQRHPEDAGGETPPDPAAQGMGRGAGMSRDGKR